ncbi:MAG TPA: polysaccharide deacetylase family protein [Caulobacteraceae bacterium]|jgi:peptidoglycan/xylan/chitin deacetylase (PgdA/CDA1 family)
MEVYGGSFLGKFRRRAARLQARRPAPRGPGRPMISFTFDDAPLTAARAGAAILEQRGLKGTWFIASAMLGGDSPSGPILIPADVRALADAGHEIACHTYSHLDCGAASPRRIIEDVERNLSAFAEAGLPIPETFAYPYGEVSGASKRALGPRFGLSRSVRRGLVGQGADLNQAPGVGIEGPEGEDLARHWLAAAKQQNAWVILFTHDVAEQPSQWGCTPGALERLADEALAQGFEVVTVAEGCRRIGAL